jgi:predicted DNA-binding protein with PD1-like motif
MAADQDIGAPLRAGGIGSLGAGLIDTWPLRLLPGQDLRARLESAAAGRVGKAAFVVAGIGSLRTAAMRRAGATQAETQAGPFEILSLSGTLSADGAHLHIALSDASGQVIGGHVAPGCIVETTAEILIARLPDWRFSREFDPATGWRELVVTRVGDDE